MAKFKENSIGAIFQNRVEQYGDKTLAIWKNKDKWEEISWNKINEMVRDLGLFLINRGVKPGEKVALFSPNRYEWWVADLAILSIGAVDVPIYATNSAEESRYILDNSDSKMCLVGTAEHMEKILQAKTKLPGLGEIVIFDEIANPPQGVLNLKDAYKEGKAYKNKDEFDKRIPAIDFDDVATIIYTSGTTGNPKGVMLTHKNFVSNVQQCEALDPDFFEGDHLFLSFLPLAHSLERTCGYYAPLYLGKRVAFSESVDKLLMNFQEVRPTFLVSVPRIYEKVHAGVVGKMAAESPVKRSLFNWAMGVARDSLPYICEDRPKPGWLGFKYNLADKIIFSKIKSALGMDKMVAAISGGGPLSVADAEFILGLGIKAVEGYGLTETTPVIAANRPKRIKPGTVGPAVKDTIIKIGEDGEILVKGPQIMKGYYKNPEATKEAFTEDGFFRTGDIGELDADGYLKITGRLKDIIVTSGGKNISPQNIENALVTSPFIEQVAVIGDNRKFLSALIVPSFSTLEAWAKNNNISFSSRKDLVGNPEVYKLFDKEISEIMKDFGRVEQIRKFTLLDAEWSQDTGELTPTLKVKRKVINQKYASIIDAMYPND
jgi:long-chain acyl-CoA synthetase